MTVRPNLQTLTHDDYGVAIICPMEVEMSAVRYMLDEEHARLPNKEGDSNRYICGRMSGHNVVIAYLPQGSQGVGAAAVVATDVKRSFPHVSLRLLVGIGGGVPSKSNDIRLGDVVVSMPTGVHGGVVQYDLGKDTITGFERKGFLEPPPTAWRNCVVEMQSDHRVKNNQIAAYITEMMQRYPSLAGYGPPTAEKDVLFVPSYMHPPGEHTCAKCDSSQQVDRPPRSQMIPKIFYGLIASGNRVEKNAEVRDKIAQDAGGALCFEMEAAGLMNDFRCIVVRGISDYADSHKNDDWHAYGAAVAAGCAKELLTYMDATLVERKTNTHKISTSSVDPCLADLRLTDPSDDKKRIEETKGGLLAASHLWILEHSAFVEWRNESQDRVLWIHGDPGKGKTMLLCGIIDHLTKTPAQHDVLSYFFCQATDSRINHPTGLLRGLIYLLVKQAPSLISHVQEKYSSAGKFLFEDANAWFALSEIFINILKGLSAHKVYLVIDALDEIVSDLPKLLNLIVEKSTLFPNVKWIVSSRKNDEIGRKLGLDDSIVKLSLESRENAEQVSLAVGAYIDHCVSKLREIQHDRELQNLVRTNLKRKANGTFLWVSLVIRELNNVRRWEVMRILDEFPTELKVVYQRMIGQIEQLPSRYREHCQKVLSIIVSTFRPLHLLELYALSDLPAQTQEPVQTTTTIVNMCASFLIIKDDNIYVIHQSAKDFLSRDAEQEIFPGGAGRVHYSIFLKSLDILSKTLRRNMYNLPTPGSAIERAKRPYPDPLVMSRYATVYWVDHLCESFAGPYGMQGLDSEGRTALGEFLNKKYLYWLEASSLCQSMSKSVVSMVKLETLIRGKLNETGLVQLVRDASRFVMYHKPAIENSPLQAYISALVFSPSGSLIKNLFIKESPEWFTTRPAVEGQWSACLQTLEGHDNEVRAIAFSRDSSQLASCSKDYTIHIWDTNSGKRLQTLSGLTSKFNQEMKRGNFHRITTGTRIQRIALTFVHDSVWLALLFEDGTIKVADASNGEILRTLGDNDQSGPCPCRIAFSSNAERIVSASHGGTLKLWDVNRAKCLQVLERPGWYSSAVTGVAFSYDSTLLAVAWYPGWVEIRDASSGTFLRTLKSLGARTYGVSAIAFSHDALRFALATEHHGFKVTVHEASTGHILQTLKGHSLRPEAVAFSHDSARLASASGDGTVRIWDTNDSTQALSNRLSSESNLIPWKKGMNRVLQIYEDLWAPKGHTDTVTAVTLSHDLSRLASASLDGTVRIWDAANSKCLHSLTHSHTIHEWISVSFSPDSVQLAASSSSGLNVWGTANGKRLRKLDGKGHLTTFSHDLQRLAAVIRSSGKIEIWDIVHGKCMWALDTSSARSFDDEAVTALAFTYDSALLAWMKAGGTVTVWDTSHGEIFRTLRDQRMYRGSAGVVRTMAFSRDSSQIALVSQGGRLEIWEVSSGTCLQIYEIGRKLRSISFDTNGSRLYTDIGTIFVNATKSSATTSEHPKLRVPRYEGWALSADGMWITYNSENWVWLPPEYRPSCSAVSQKMIIIGVGYGDLWFFDLDEPDSISG